VEQWPLDLFEHAHVLAVLGEARYYSLWFMLTAGQSLLFLDRVFKKEENPQIIPFMLVHTGLCLTALCLIQNHACLGLCWSAGIQTGEILYIRRFCARYF